MNTKHTPGPWISRCGYVVAQSGTDDEILICRVRRDVKEAPANCDLFAAAPDLLEFAQDWIDRQGSDENYMTAKARTAIAKATGKQP